MENKVPKMFQQGIFTPFCQCYGFLSLSYAIVLFFELFECHQIFIFRFTDNLVTYFFTHYRLMNLVVRLPPGWASLIKYMPWGNLLTSIRI